MKRIPRVERLRSELADRRVLLASVLVKLKAQPRAWNLGYVWTQQINDIRGQLGKLSMDHEVCEILAETRFFGEIAR